MSSTPAAPVHVRAPAKVNVFLRVGALQEDGYHEVATAYQAVGLFDEIRAWPADDFSVSFTGPVDTSELVTDSRNLAIRAAKALARKTGFAGGARLEIEKHIPIAGGMGGGSADAAGTLVACDALWSTGLSRDDLLPVAARLGADVPFALLGGTAIGSGRGDRLSPALAQGTLYWVIVLAEFGLSTPDVYHALDEHRDRHALDISPAQVTPVVDPSVLQALRAGDARQLADTMENDLQAPALRLRPELAATLELGEANGALTGIVSGSGPTIAFLAEDRDAALALQIALSASGLTALKVTGPVHGARLVAE